MGLYFQYNKKVQKSPDVYPTGQGTGYNDFSLHALYSQLLIKTCHKRKVHAMGGMAAQIPIKYNDEANFEAMKKVIADKEREVQEGHDGTWVAHPALVSIVKEVFDKYMPEPNQIKNKREDVNVTAEDLLSRPVGTITIDGIKTNIDVGIQYIEAWLNGNGCVPIYNLMEDAATAEISRTQIWQWLNNPEAALEDGTNINNILYSTIFAGQINKLREMVGEIKFNNGAYLQAAEIFDSLVREKKFTEFLTLKTYDYI